MISVSSGASLYSGHWADIRLRMRTAKRLTESSPEDSVTQMLGRSLDHLGKAVDEHSPTVDRVAATSSNT